MDKNRIPKEMFSFAREQTRTEDRKFAENP